ncbi:MAG: pyrimidine operon attenuation protein/uracil phosphoribosyltransferase [Cyclobacteriaceae bacterium]|jgi:pyrimidine operon attenuation protein/uracil phosphoribosyltransferase
MQKRLLLNSHHLKITISRLCHQLVENHNDFKDSVILGLQPKGIFLAERIKSELEEITGNSIDLGYLDTTFYRDDFRRRDEVITPNETKIPFIIEKKKVIIVDDVLYTGRSVRAAMDAMIAFGRPDKVELLILIDRIHSRDIPVEANYVGRKVNTIQSQKVLVELKEQNKKEDNIWLIDKEEIK